MPWPFDRPFMQLALVACAVVGATAPLIGSFIVQRRLSLMGDGIGHVAFAGVGLGLLLEVWPVWSALAVSVGAALGIEALRRTGVVPGDLALAAVFYGGIAAGVVMAESAGAFNGSLLGILVGQPLTVTPTEVWVIVALGAVVAAGVALGGRALFAIVVDEESARVAGLPVDALNAALAIGVAVTVVIGMRAVGVLLIAALMVLPVGASQAVARSFRATLLGASVVGLASAVVGLGVSRAWGSEPGSTIVLVAAAAFVLSALSTRARRGTRMPANPLASDAGRKMR